MATNWDQYLEDALADSDLQERFERAGVAWDIALQIASLREQRGLTQTELAQRMGSKQSNVSRLESGDYRGYSFQSLDKVARALRARVQVNFVPVEQQLRGAPGSPVEFDTLAEVFAQEDAVAQQNWAAAPAEFNLIEHGIALGFSITLWLQEDPIIAKREAKPADIVTTETICANLLHAAWSSLLNATRMALQGAHVEALTLARTALEATYHAEYFRDHPAEAVEWDKTGSITNLKDLRRSIVDLERKMGARKKVQQKYEPDESLSDLYAEVSTYGAHVNPKTVAQRLSSARPGIANLGFASVGKSQATRLCAAHILHILGYTLSEFWDSFGAYLRQNADLVATYEQFGNDLTALRAAAPEKLSLTR